MADFQAPMAANGQLLPLPDLDWGAAQVLAIGTSSVQSTPIAARVIVVSSDTDCWITCGDNPTAQPAQASLYIPSGRPMVMVPFLPGQRLAVINTPTGSSGHLSIVPAINPS